MLPTSSSDLGIDKSLISLILIIQTSTKTQLPSPSFHTCLLLYYYNFSLQFKKHTGEFYPFPACIYTLYSCAKMLRILDDSLRIFVQLAITSFHHCKLDRHFKVLTTIFTRIQVYVLL